MTEQKEDYLTTNNIFTLVTDCPEEAKQLKIDADLLLKERSQGYTEELYDKFFQAYMDSAGPRRNGARAVMISLTSKYPKSLLDKMFERVKLEPTFEE